MRPLAVLLAFLLVAPALSACASPTGCRGQARPANPHGSVLQAIAGPHCGATW
ncbi:MULTISPECIES: hypothetical protein [unclassified Phenylobacterium]|jgi:hypothetical protein|uniref:hypothetical protein n=1 Tax=unclassified Phenylobacterium TaxID=2640670 RepID=UPI000AED27B6|nr:MULTISPECIES: hypothetical protein [unclassified Phenylobacterium]